MYGAIRSRIGELMAQAKRERPLDQAMPTPEEILDGIDRSPQSWWPNTYLDLQRRERERRLDEAVRAWSVDIHLPGCAKVTDGRLGEWLMMYGYDFRIRAEYRRIVEREEIQESMLDATR